MEGKRIRYDWLYIIDDWQLRKEFDAYCREHKKVRSEKRLARSFVKSKHIPLLRIYEVGKCIPAMEIAKVKWLED